MNEVLEDIFGNSHVLNKQLGAKGGQGSVFRTEDPNIAVKLISTVKDEEKSVDELNRHYTDLRLLPIHTKTHITLPCAVLSKRVGYVMQLLDDMQDFDSAVNSKAVSEFNENPWLKKLSEDTDESVAGFFNDYICSGARRRRLNMYREAAETLALLHSRGLVYCDFSGRNCFVSTEADNIVWLIDSDNLGFAGKLSPDIVCTERFAAPEVINKAQFSMWSDCYSFAVSLFCDLMCAHPFIGALCRQKDDEDSFDEEDEFGDADAFAEDWESVAYQGNLPWILDKNDSSNRIYDGLLNNPEDTLTAGLLRLFDRTFSETGRHRRKSRPTMQEWFFALSEAADTSIRCSHCGMDFDASSDRCPWCGSKPLTITLESVKDGHVFWRISREADEGKLIQIPERLINGPKISADHSYIFSVQCHEDSVSVSDMAYSFSWAVSVDDGKSFREIFGTVDIPNGSFIRCTNKDTKESVIVEVYVL